MTQYMIWFPGAWMDVPDEEFAAVGAAASAVVDEIKAAGVYVFAGGIDEDVPPVLVSGDGSVSTDAPQLVDFDGGVTIVDVPTRDEALAWAAKIAVACRCPQEVRVFQVGRPR